MQHSEKVKTLVLLTLPIGNLSDLSSRAKIALEEGTFFVAEDTRNLKKIMNLLAIDFNDKLILSFHDHSSEEKIHSLIEKLHQYRTLYIVSDAGSPLVSDPAFPLVKQAQELGIGLTSIPGASAMCVGLELSGLPPIPFHFHGFFPRRDMAQDELMDKLTTIEGTHLFFESPERIVDSLNRWCPKYAELEFAVVKEMTKKFERAWRFKGKDWESVRASIPTMGEFVFLFHVPKSAIQAGMSKEFSRIEAQKICQEILKVGTRPKLISKLIGLVLGVENKEIYDQLSSLNK